MDSDQNKVHQIREELLDLVDDGRNFEEIKNLLENHPNILEPSFTLPIEKAVRHGYHDIFELLLNYHTKLPIFILTTLLRLSKNDNLPTAGINWTKCYRHLINKIKSDNFFLDINELDGHKESPLRYAIRYCPPQFTEELFDLGASLGTKNNPVEDMKPEELERHLDKCIQIKKNDERIEKYDEKWNVSFNYRSLVPPSKKERSHNIGETREHSETNVMYSGGQPETIVMLPSVHSETSVMPLDVQSETNVICYISKHPKFKHLLTHPVIFSFLLMKWSRMKWLFWTNLAFYSIFCVSLLIFISHTYADVDFNEKNTWNDSFARFPWVLLTITLLALLSREICQFDVLRLEYFKDFENCVEVVLIFITGYLLFIPSEKLKIELSAISVLLATVELVLILGQYPNLSMYVQMLRKVSWNFFKFFIWYSLLIVAFAFSFHIIFIKRAKIANRNENLSFFSNFFNATFRTLVMVTGEFDTTNLDFGTFPYTSTFIFTLFILIMVMVFLNLLIGLAVSDTQMIQQEAELMGHIYITQYLMNVERILLNEVSSRYTLRKAIPLCLIQKLRLFQTVSDYNVTIYPNKVKQEIQLAKSKINIELDKETLRRIHSIVEASI